MTQSPANGAFQLYPATDEALVAEIPDSLAFEQAVVLPLAVSTASAGLYRRDYLNLPLPSADDVKSTGQVLLVWGGASSVGATTIQLAVASPCPRSLIDSTQACLLRVCCRVTNQRCDFPLSMVRNEVCKSRLLGGVEIINSIPQLSHTL
jgi:hypothetical protein